MDLDKKEKIGHVIKTSLRKKFKNYKPETKHMPFHYRLLGKDRMALYSFIQSLNTTFGTSIYEPVAVAVAEDRFKFVSSHVKPHQYISQEAHRQIQQIMDDLITAKKEPNKINEIDFIRKVCQTGKSTRVKLTTVDLWLQNENDELFLIELKTVKPNIGGFK